MADYGVHRDLAEEVVSVEPLLRSAEPNSQIFLGPPEVDGHCELIEAGRRAVELEVEFYPV